MRHRNHGLRKRCGCPRSKWPKCPHGWHLNFSWRGVHYRLSLDRETGRHIETKAEAQREADRIRMEIREGPSQRGRHDDVARDSRFDQFLLRFFKEYSTSPVPGRRRRGQNGAKASWRDDRAILKAIGAFSVQRRTLGERRVVEISERHAELFLQHLATLGRAASTRNHYLRMWKLLGKWAVKMGYRDRPFIGLETELRQDRWAQRKRRISEKDERRLIGAANPRLQRLIVAALETGARRGELLSLQWEDVDIGRRELRLRAEKTKDGEDRILPITDKLCAVLEMARLAEDGTPLAADRYVFGTKIGDRIKSPKTAWATACRKAGLDDLHFHDLRHEAGSRWVEGGVPIHHVQALLGHSNVKQTSTYLNVSLTGLKESVSRFEKTRQTCTNVAQTAAQPASARRSSARRSQDKSLSN